MKSEIKVSITVPIYGVEKYIERCAVSLFEQTYNNIEYIFVNDKTKDNSISILYDVISRFNRSDKVKVIEHENNKGLAGARLTGLKNATGDYIMFVDSDDFIEPNAVERMVFEIEKDNSDIVISGFNHVFPSGKILTELPKTCSLPDYLEKVLRREVALNVWAKLYKKSLFSDHDISFVEGVNMGEDYVVTSRLMYCAKCISFIDKPLYNYVHFNNNSYTTTFKRKNLDEIIIAEEIVRDFYTKIGDSRLLGLHAIGNQKLKAEFLILLLRSNMHNKQDFDYVKQLFLDDENIPESIRSLKLQDRLILKLSQILPEPFMAFIVRKGFKIKQIIKHI